LKEESLENFDVLASHEIVNWFRLESLEHFPLLGSPSPHSFKKNLTKEEGTPVPLEFFPSSSKTQPLFVKPETPPSYTLHLLKIPDIQFASFPIKSPHTCPKTQNLPLPDPMAVANPSRNRIDAIVAARYAPLVLTQPMNSLPVGYYLKYMPKFTGEEDITAEEHLSSFYSYADNLNIENEDVWMRVFVQSLDVEAKKCFRGLPPRSITRIEALDDAFLRHWGDKKDFLYYITEFGALKRKYGESVSDFSKRFNKMYNKIPTEIKPTETSTKITYSSAFDLDFFLLLRERRSNSLSHMKDASLEVESNILVANKLRGKSDRDRRKQKEKDSTSDASTTNPQVDELTKLVKSLST
jgi:hypothetical protein